MFNVPGQVGRNGLSNLPAVLETHEPLDAVVLALGKNDIFLPAVTAAYAAAGIENLVAAIRTAEWSEPSRIPAILAVVPPPFLPIYTRVGSACSWSGGRIAPAVGGIPCRSKANGD